MIGLYCCNLHSLNVGINNKFKLYNIFKASCVFFEPTVPVNPYILFSYLEIYFLKKVKFDM